MAEQAKKTSTKSIRQQLFEDSDEGKRIKRTLSNGVEIEMCEPTKGQRNRIINESRTDDEGNFNPFDFIMRIAVECSFVPGKDVKVFNDGDYEKICNLRGADWVDELVEIAQEVTNVSREDTVKN